MAIYLVMHTSSRVSKSQRSCARHVSVAPRMMSGSVACIKKERFTAV